MRIGPVSIPYHSDQNLNSKRGITSVPDIGSPLTLGYKDPSGAPTFNIKGVIVKDSIYTKSVSNQMMDILGLLQSDVDQNYSTTAEFDGFLSIKSVKIEPVSDRFTLRKTTITGLAYPRTSYLKTIVGNPKILNNDFSLTLGSNSCDYYIPVPIGSDYYNGDGTVITRTGVDGVITLVKATSSKEVDMDITGPQSGVGECKCYDSVIAGDLTEANWVRVFNRDHSFLGDIILDNSLYRIIISYSNNYITIYYYNGTTFIKIDDFEIEGITFTSNDLVVTDIHMDMIKVRLNRSYDIWLGRGIIPYIDSDTDILVSVTLSPLDQSTSGDNYLNLGTDLYISSNLNFSIVAASKQLGTGKKWIFYTSSGEQAIAHQSLVIPNNRSMLTQRL